MNDPTLPDHVEAAEKLDNGVRLALQMERELMAIAEPPTAGDRFDGLGPDPEKQIDDALIGQVADRVAEWRHEAAQKLRHLDKHAPRHIHTKALAMVAAFDDLLDEVREHLRGDS